MAIDVGRADGARADAGRAGRAGGAGPGPAGSGVPVVDLERFEREGFVVLEAVFDPERDLDPVVREYGEVLDRITAEWVAEGRIRSTYADLPFAERFAHVLNDTGAAGYRPFDISLGGKLDLETPLYRLIHLGPAIFHLITHPRLVGAVEQIVGPEVLSNPIQHVRIKPPEALIKFDPGKRFTMVSATEWHQDQGVATIEVDNTEMLTVWFPVLEATIENGCLCVIPGSHKKGLVTHCPALPGQNWDLRIPESIRGTSSLPVPMARGSAILMHRRTMHSSLRNLSRGVRWSFDLRYQPVGQPTGRDWLPSFVVRSRRDPSSELHDWREWARLWEVAREAVVADPTSVKPRRWTGTEAVCA
jgi:phytanoyl-CoA hydroxylase